MSWLKYLFHKDADPSPPETVAPAADAGPCLQSAAVRHGGTLEERGRYLTGAAEHYHLSEVDKILSAGETFDPASLSIALLHVARRNNGLEGLQVARALITKGADVDFQEEADGETALGIAIAARDLDLVRVLVEARADPTLCGMAGFSPLYYCFLVQGEDMKAIADEVRRARPKRFTPDTLFQAAQCGVSSLVRQAIEAGVDLNAKHESGATALEFAAENGHSDIVELLRTYGATN